MKAKSTCNCETHLRLVPVIGDCILRQDPLENILVIVGRRALIFLFESSWKKMKNYTTFVRMRSCDHLGNAKMSKKGTSIASSDLTF